MALKQRFKIESNFSLASMTDVIFLLLIFFHDHIYHCSAKRYTGIIAKIAATGSGKTHNKGYHRQGYELLCSQCK